MALLVFEGFDHLAAANSTALDLALSAHGKWTYSGNTNRNTGLLGGIAIGCGTNAYLHYTPGSSYGTLVAGLRYRPTNAGVMQDFLRFYDGSNVRCGVSCNASGKLIFWRGTNATVLATSTRTLLSAGWYLIEIKVTFDASAGVYTVYIDGTQEFTATGANTSSSTTVTGVRFGDMSGTGTTPQWDDFYLFDTTGNAPFNDILSLAAFGPLYRVESLFASADDDVEFTPLSSTNASNVDETQTDDDTTYNSSGTPGAIDYFTHGSMGTVASRIFAVNVVSKLRKDDVTTVSARNKLKSDDTVIDGATVPMTVTYQYLYDTYLVDPDTGVPWINSGVNNSKIGYEYVS